MPLTAAELNATYAVDEGPLDRSIGGIADKVRGQAAAVAAAAGFIGAGLAGGIMQALENERAVDLVNAQLGATGDYAADIGRIAGNLFAGAYAGSVGEAAQAVRDTLRSGLLEEDATNAEIEAVTAQLTDLAGVLETDVGGAAHAAGQLVRTGLADNAEHAMDLLARGVEQGANDFGDLADTLTNSSATLAQFGLSGEQAVGLITQSLAAGAPSADFFIGALEELAGNAGDSVEVFDALGLSGQQMARDLTAGGPAASAALQSLLGALQGMQDPAARSTALVGLFGEEATAMSDVLLSLDPTTAVQALGDVAGAADGVSAAVNDNAATALTSFKNTVQLAVVNFLGGKALPVLQTVATFLAASLGPAVSTVAGFFSGTLVPALQTAGQWLGDHQGVLAAVAGIITLLLLPTLTGLAVKYATTAAAAVASAATQSAAWVATQVRALGVAAVLAVSYALQVAGWIGMAVAATANAAIVVAGWVLMGAQSLIQAARMAAAWVIAMGPVGWVIAAVVGLVALIIANWDTVVSWTKTAWDTAVGWVRTAWEWIKGAVQAGLNFLVSLFLNFTGVGLIIKHWDTIVAAVRNAWEWIKGAVRAGVDWVIGAIGWLGQLPGRVAGWFGGVKDAAVGKLNELLGWLGGLPGRVLSAIGSFGSLLLSAGRDLLSGLWSGIQGAAGWLRDRIMSFFGSLIPGWVKDVFGISSPSKVFAGFGRYLMQGLAVGMDAETSVAVAAAERAAMAVNGAMALTPPAIGLRTPTGAYGTATAAAGAAGATGDGRGALFHADSVTVIEGTPDDVARQLELGARTRGNW